MEPSKKEKFNAAPPPTIAYTADVAMAVAANAADRAKQQEVSLLLPDHVFLDMFA